jgi:glucose-6-phosphate isomerase, archaeal
MSELLEPFSAQILPAGTLDPERKTDVRRLSDIHAIYQQVPEGLGNPVVYRVHHIPVPETNSEIQTSTTVLEAGTVGDEYFMTKGHFHAIRERSEVYVGLSGEGLLLMANEAGDHRVVEMRQGTVAYVPGGWAHRSANTGSEPLVFFAAFVGDAGHDYGTVAERGFPVLAVRGASGPEIVANPRYASPSS